MHRGFLKVRAQPRTSFFVGSCLAIAVLLSSGAGAAASRLNDINVTPIEPGSSPSGFVRVGATTFFAAATASTGAELWKTDGTAAGTTLVKDLVPGELSSSPGLLVDIGGTLFFRASGGLWKSDGTEAGTVLVRQLAQITALRNVNGTLFLVADGGQQGRELWRSDGTAAGTVQVKDIRPGSEGGLDVASLSFASVGDVLFFIADDGTSGVELWRTDGTEAGTRMVKDLWNTAAGGSGSQPRFLTTLGSKVFFSAAGDGDRELWETDGTPEGTLRVANIRAIGQSTPDNLTAVGSTLFFVADDGSVGRELWKHDASGTALVADLTAGATSTTFNQLAAVGGRLFLLAGQALWVSDGSTAGTQPIRTGLTSPTGLVDLQGLAMFVNGQRLYRSDGTDSGTTVMGSFADVAGTLSVVGSSVMYAATDRNGQEPWSSDGTHEGTRELANVNPAIAPSSKVPPAGKSAWSHPLGNVRLFTAYDATSGWELWKTDGTSAGTVQVLDLAAGTADSYPQSFVTLDATRALFTATDAAGEELWVTDGTAEGTKRVEDLNPGSASSSPRPAMVWQGVAYFAANDPVALRELWRSDGTEAGTYLLKDIEPGATSSGPQLLGPLGASFYFMAIVGDTVALWKTDGTPEGTVQVAGLEPRSCTGCAINLGATEKVGERLVFALGNSVWATDGTAVGTSKLQTLTRSVLDFVVLKGKAYFMGTDETSGSEPWSTDGTVAGTVRVADVLPGAAGSSPSRISVLGGQLVFIGVDADARNVLYKLDPETGTASLISSMAVSRGALFADETLGTVWFAGASADAGVELWQTTPALEGVKHVQDIAPGRANSNPYAFARLGAGVFFHADDGTGFEPWWAADPSSEPPPDVTPPQITCPENQVVFSATATVVPPHEATATDDSSTPAITYSPEQTAEFPVGVTRVTATAMDQSGNTATCHYLVVIQPPEPPPEPVEPEIAVSGCGCGSAGSAGAPWFALLAIVAATYGRRTRVFRPR